MHIYLDKTSGSIAHITKPFLSLCNAKISVDIYIYIVLKCLSCKNIHPHFYNHNFLILIKHDVPYSFTRYNKSSTTNTCDMSAAKLDNNVNHWFLKVKHCCFTGLFFSPQLLHLL